jgi:hypothetical protein
VSLCMVAGHQAALGQVPGRGEGDDGERLEFDHAVDKFASQLTSSSCAWQQDFDRIAARELVWGCRGCLSIEPHVSCNLGETSCSAAYSHSHCWARHARRNEAWRKPPLQKEI